MIYLKEKLKLVNYKLQNSWAYDIVTLVYMLRKSKAFRKVALQTI